MSLKKKKEAEVVKKKKKAAVVEAPVKKKKKVVEEAPAKKKKKKVVEAEAPAKKKKKKVVAEAPAKKGKKSAKAEKPAKKKARKEKELPTYSPVKEKLRAAALIEHLADLSEVDKKEVKKVLEALTDTMCGSIVKKGVGEFQLPGFFKVKTVKKPAKKGGEKVKNPFKPGEMMITKAKPASIKVKILPLKKMKDAVMV